MLRQLASVFVTHAETQSPVLGNIRGNIPVWLKGNLLFTCPGGLDLASPVPESSQPDFTVNHLKDGLALLGKFSFHGDEAKNKKVTFQTRYLQSDAYKKAVANGRTVLPEYGTSSALAMNAHRGKGGLFSLLAGNKPPSSDNGNRAIYRLGSNFYASNGQTYFTQINPADLSTGARFETNQLFGIKGLSAHPLADAQGNVWNLGATLGVTSGATLSFISVQPDKEASGGHNGGQNFKNFKITGSIPSVSATYLSAIHSFGMTANYLIYIESPATLNLGKYLRTTIGAYDYATLDLIEWLPDHKNKFHIVDKQTGDLLTRKIAIEASEAFYYENVVNCYEEDRHLVVDVLSYPTWAAINGATIQNLRGGIPLCKPGEEGALQRFKFSLDSSAAIPAVNVAPENLSLRGISSITINDRYVGKPYRYCYGVGDQTSGAGAYSNSIVKFDLESKKVATNSREIARWTPGSHGYMTAVTFVENPEGAGQGHEDDGVLIGGVCDLRSGHPDYLVILSARDLSEIGRIEFKCKIPAFAHALYVPE